MSKSLSLSLHQTKGSMALYGGSMAGYMKDARRHAEKIKYYYENAGSRGYDQSIYHFDKLKELIFKAMQS